MFRVVIFFVIFQTVSCKIETELLLIENVLYTFEKKPFVIILGYEKNDAIRIITKLSNINIQSNIYNIFNNDYSVNPEEYCLFLLKFDDLTSVNILEKANINNLFRFPMTWLLMNNNINLNFTNIINKISMFNILVDSNFIIAKTISENNYIISKFYKRHINDTNIISESFYSWSKNTGLEIIEKNFINADRRKNLLQTILKTSIVITHNNTLKHLTDYRNKHIDSITKVNYILVNHLSNYVNAELSYLIQNTWGYQDNNSLWTGMLGDLTQNRADVGGTPLFVTTDRVKIIDYIAMTTPTRSYFVFRQPKLSYVTNVFTLPFHWTVWLSSIVLVIITTIGLYVMLKWENFTKKTDPGWNLESRDAPVISIGAICQQGTSEVPDMTSGRILTLFIFVSLMFLYTSYSANIVALLQSSSNSIQTLEDLLKSRLQVGVDDTVFNRFYFPAATEPIRKALYEQKVAPKNQPPKFLPIEIGVKKIRQGLYAFHMEGGSGYKIIGETFYEDEKCDLQEISFLQVPDPWLAIQKNSSYKEMLKIGLRKIRESGLQNREVAKVYTKKPKCHGSASSFVSVGLLDIYAAIEIYVIGLSISIFLFIVEIIMNKRLCIVK